MDVRGGSNSYYGQGLFGKNVYRATVAHECDNLHTEMQKLAADCKRRRGQPATFPATNDHNAFGIPRPRSFVRGRSALAAGSVVDWVSFLIASP
jgi:hypothetical protein